MKNLIIPIETNDCSINIAELTPRFNGLVIGYKNNIPVGYIVYDEDCIFTSDADIDCGEVIACDTDLLHLIRRLINSEICTNFKVLEFGN